MGLMAPARFAIAHVTPHPWEARESEVNAYVEGVARELSARGHRVLVLAPSLDQERVRACRRALRGVRSEPHRLLEGTDGGEAKVLAVGEALEVPGGGSSRLRPPP